MTKLTAFAINLAASTILFGTGSAVAENIPLSVVISSAQLAQKDTSQIGALDVYFASEVAEPIDIAGFQLTLSIVGPDNAVKLTGTAAPLLHSYLFAPASTAPLGSVSPDGSQITFGDFLNIGFAKIVDGAGIASVHFVIEPSAAGKSYRVVASLEPDESFLGVDATTFLPFNVHNGSITSIPEPAAIILAVISACCAALRRGVAGVYRNRENRFWTGPFS